MDGSKWWHWIIYLGFPIPIIGGLMLASHLVDRSYDRFAESWTVGGVKCVVRNKRMYLGKIDDGSDMKESYWLEIQEQANQNWLGLTDDQAEVKAWRRCFAKAIKQAANNE